MSDERSMHELDLHELQRLLDGTMTAEQRTLFLDQADDRPEYWRAIALAFVEEQVLRHELGALVASDSWMGVDLVSKYRESGDRKRSRNRLRLVAMAAMVLVMLGLGAWAGNLLRKNKNPGTSYVMWLERDEPSEPSDTRNESNDLIPLKSESEPEQLDGEIDSVIPSRTLLDWIATPLFDAESRRVIQDHGFTVHDEPVLYVVDSGEGRPYLLPYRQASFEKSP